MNTIILSIHKKSSLLLVALLMATSSFATIYTATTSGAYSSSATWVGGVAPPYTVSTDQIFIGSGLTVNLDGNMALNGALAQLNVEGSLNTSNNSSLTLDQGTLSGDGFMALNVVELNAGSTFSFTGILGVNTLNVNTAVTSAATITAGQALNLTSGALTLASGGSLIMGNNGTIFLSGGLLTVGVGGSVNLTAVYNVNYTGTTTIAGVELTGAGLNNLDIGINGTNPLTLTADLSVQGAFTLNSGRLILDGYDLSINDVVAVAGTGTITSTSLSNISINSPAGTFGALTFTGANAEVNNLAINTGSGNKAYIGGILKINGTLSLNSGILGFDNASLTIAGNITGNGSLSGNLSSNLDLSSLTSAASTLTFDVNGQEINDLKIAVSLSNSPSLGSALTVHGLLTLTGTSNFNLNGQSFTMANTSSLTGNGAFVATPTSNLRINSDVGISSLEIVGTIGNLTINTGETANVTMGSDLITDGLLSLLTGTLVLNNYDLTINGDLAVPGTGTVASTTSDITIASPTTTSGSLNFASASSVRNLTIGVGNQGAARIGTDLMVEGVLHFNQGKLNIHDNTLYIANAGSITGVDTSSYIITALGGYLDRRVTTNTPVAFPVGNSVHYAPAIVHLNPVSTNGQFQIGVVRNVLANGTSGADISVSQPMVDATWHVSSDITNLDMNLEVMWSAAMEVNGFNANASYVSHYENNNWEPGTPSVAIDEIGGLFSLTRNSITTLSPFAVFDENTVTAVAEISNDVRFAIYPNPAVENITISNGTYSTEPMQMDIYNSTGQLVSSQQLVNVISVVSLKDLANGNYFIRFYNSQVNSSAKFIKM